MLPSCEGVLIARDHNRSTGESSLIDAVAISDGARSRDRGHAAPESAGA
jgi:hypothetical protein